MTADRHDGTETASPGCYALTEVLDRFERAWHPDAVTDFTAFLPPAGHPERLEILVELIQTDLERRFRSGLPARVEDYLTRHPEVAADSVLTVQLVLAEARLRRRRGDAVELDDYLRRFPHVGEYLRAHWPVAVSRRSTAANAADTLSPGEAASEASLPAGAVVPDNEILGELGRGAMGVVYRARQLSLPRVVALKMIRADWAADPTRRALFRREAEAVARLQHPNVVQVFAAGEWQRGPNQVPVPFLAMELVDGGNLHAELAAKPLPSVTAAALVESLARAMQAAHEKGIVHRDLKPENVLLAACGLAGLSPPAKPQAAFIPKVTDFGLAKLTEASQSLLASGAVVGTPAYMAPEQALGQNREVGPAADVYSLGAILYECLTGRPPFLGATLMETLEQVVRREAVPPRQLNPAVDRDLDTITLKCLQKDSARRYASAADLAEDLRRFRAHEPIRARPVGPAERGWRWCRRNPAVAMLLGAVAATLLVGIVTATTLAVYAHDEAVLADQQAKKAQENEATARSEKQQADEARTQAETEKAGKALQLEQAREHLVTAQLQRVAGVYERSPLRGLALLDDQTACPPELRDPAWYFYRNRCRVLRHRLEGFAEDVCCLAFSPDGQTLAVGTGEFFGAVNDDRKKAGEVRLFDAATGRPGRVLSRHTDRVDAVAFSPDGKWLATASEEDRTVRVWDVETGRQLHSFAGVAREVAFTPDGKAVLAGGEKVRRIDLDTGKEEVLVEDGRWWVAFSPDGQTAAVSAGFGPDGEVKLWDLAAGRLRTTMKWGTSVLYRLAFSADGRYLAAGGGRKGKDGDRVIEGEVVVWEVGQEQPVQKLRGNVNAVACVAFGPDGRSLAAGFGDPAGGGGDVWVWDLRTGQPRQSLEGHSGRMWAVAFGPEGTTLASGGHDRTACVWDLRAGQPRKLETGKPAGWLALAPDGKTLAAGDWDGQITLWDAVSGERRRTLQDEGGGFREFRFTDDGTLLTVGADKRVRSWDSASDKPRSSVELRGLEVTFDFIAALAPDRRSLAVSTGFGPVQVFDTAAGSRTASFEPGQYIKSLAWSPDGRLLAAGSSGQVQLWNFPPGGGPRFRLATVGEKDYQAEVRGLAFSGDGQFLATGDEYGLIKLWDVAAGRELRTLRGHGNVVYDLAFTRDGKTLASAMGNSDGYPGEVRLWNVQTGQGRAVLGGQTHSVYRVLFGRDEQVLFSSAGDSRVWVWDLSRP